MTETYRMRRPKLPYGRCLAGCAIALWGCGGAQAQVSAPASLHERVHVAEGRDGGALAWSSVVERAARSDFTLIGEVHGHPDGLAIAAELFSEVARQARPTLCLEFFERDEQADLDAYVAGRTTEEELLRATDKDEQSYPPGHRAMVETAKAKGLAVVAANAPRRYAKLARSEGYDALGALPEEERALFSIPEELPGGGYAKRFAEAMGGHGESHHGGDFFLAQALWDDTMADSAVRAHERFGAPVVAVAGRFHIDHDGGLPQLVRRRRPEAALLTVSVIDAEPTRLEGDEAGRADVVIFVGPMPDATGGEGPAPGP
jgi:uncharacterized iron-regulated protein